MTLTQLFEQDNNNHAMDCPALLTLIVGAHTSQGRREIFWLQQPRCESRLPIAAALRQTDAIFLIASPACSIRATTPIGIQLVFARNSVKGCEMNTLPKEERVEEDISSTCRLAGHLDLPQRITARSGQTSAQSPCDAIGNVAQSQQSRLMLSPKALQKALKQSAERAQRLAAAFGLVVPSIKPRTHVAANGKPLTEAKRQSLKVAE